MPNGTSARGPQLLHWCEPGGTLRLNARHALIALLAAARATPAAWAVEVQGVLPASMDQPRIYLSVARTAAGPALAAKGGGAGDMLAGLLGDKPDKNGPPIPQIAVEAFLDTGASGTMLAKETADALGIKAATFAGKPVTFYDVGVAGREAFGVSEPVFLRTAEYSSRTDGLTPGLYAPAGGPVAVKIKAASGMLEELTGAIDIVGTPVMACRVMVVDCRPIANYDKLVTTLVPPGDKSIPKTGITVPLTMVDFDRFTQLEPKGAPAVPGAPNPMIGPDPFRKDAAPAVTIGHRGKTARLTMLLDTGSASTMISVAEARAIGLEVDDAGKIRNVPEKDQFTLPIGGIGGTADVPGCFIDTVVLPTAKGEPVRFVKAPVLVHDVTVKDEATGETFTLDGVLGMNYLVASASVTGGLNAGIGEIHDGPFSFFSVDFARRTLGLQLK